MSTILKALKKLEQEHESQQVSQTASVPNFNASQVVRTRMKSGWAFILHARWSWVLIGIIIAVVASYFLIERPLKSQPAPETSSNSRETPPSRSPIVQKKPVASGQSDPKLYAASPEKNFPKTTSHAIQKNKIVHKPAPTAGVQSRSADTRKNTQPQKAADPVDSQDQPEPAEQELLASAPRLTDGRLRVQAIAWSPVAQDRMAVINNRVVREGFVLDGFAIVVIGENEIMVSEGEKRWKVRFGQP